MITTEIKPEAAQAIIDHAKRNGAKPRYRFDADNHIHLLDDKPLMGTSTVCGSSLPKPALLWWASEEAALVCFEEGVEPNPTIRDELAEVKKETGYARQKAMRALQKKYPLFKKARYAHKEQKEAAAPPGQDMHAQLEAYIKDCIENNMGEPCSLLKYGHGAVEIFSSWAVKNVRKFLWSEAHCYSERLWTGGICDCGAILGGGLSVIDFKSAREPYTDHFVQTGGYSVAIKENGIFNASGCPIVAELQEVQDTPIESLTVFAFGGECEPETRYNVSDYMDGFEHVVGVHKLLRKEEKHYDNEHNS